MNSIVSIEQMAMSTMNHVSGSEPERHVASLPWPSWNGWSCDRPITMAIPQQKPSMIDAAMSVMKRSALQQPDEEHEAAGTHDGVGRA